MGRNKYESSKEYLSKQAEACQKAFDLSFANNQDAAEAFGCSLRMWMAYKSGANHMMETMLYDKKDNHLVERFTKIYHREMDRLWNL